MSVAEMTEIFGPVLNPPTWRDLIDAGDLIDVTESAKGVGVRYPMAVTKAVWEDCCVWGDEQRELHGYDQSESVRVADLTYMAMICLKRMSTLASGLGRFGLWRASAITGVGGDVDLFVRIHDDGEGEPCITVMTREEAA